MDHMRVSNILKTYGSYGAEKTNVSKKAERSTGSKDTVALSSQAKDYQIARSALSHLPEIRQDKVDSIKSKMDNGSYSIDHSALADKMLENLFA